MGNKSHPEPVCAFLGRPRPREAAHRRFAGGFAAPGSELGRRREREHAADGWPSDAWPKMAAPTGALYSATLKMAAP